MKTVYQITIILVSFFIKGQILVAQPLKPKSPVGIVIVQGGCASICCGGRIHTYFFEDGNCVYRSIDENEDRLTCFGTWKFENSLVCITYKTKFYGKPLGELFMMEIVARKTLDSPYTMP